MKTRHVNRTRTITDTVNGREVHYNEPYTDTVPVMPFSLDSLLRRFLLCVAVLATIAAVIWGTVAIGSMLTLLVPPWTAYLVAGIFDIGWVSCLIAEWLMRYNDSKAKLPRKAGYAMLVVSMTAISLHGHIVDELLVGLVGAFASAASKGIWVMAMHVTRIKLAPKYQAYIEEMEQETGAQLALAQRDRDRIITGEKTTDLRLALEARRGPVHEVHTVQEADQAPDLRVVQSGPSTDQATARPLDPADQVSVLVDLLKSGQKVTKRSAAVTLGTSETTAQRRLTEAKARLDDGTGQYL